MICRYFLHIDSDVMDVSDMIENLSDIKITYTRTGLNGVTRKCGSTINFIFSARDKLIGVYESKGINSVVYFSISQIINNWDFVELFNLNNS